MGKTPRSESGGQMRTGAALVATVVVGVVIGWLRWDVGFAPVIQGMLAGLMTGTLAGMGVRPTETVWSFRLRIAVSLAIVSLFVFGEFLGIGLAMPRFAPWDFVSMTLNGSHIDLVIGPSRGSVRPDQLRPVGAVGWLLFNALDLAFQLFLTLLGLGIQLNKKR